MLPKLFAPRPAPLLPRTLAPLLLLAGLAWATPEEGAERCAEKPYTLETAEGVAGGGNLEYEGETAVFTDGACLETSGLSLQAPGLRFDTQSGTLRAENLQVQTARYRLWAASGEVRGGVLEARGVRVTPCRCGDDLRLLSEVLRFDTVSGRVLLEESALQYQRLNLARVGKLRFDPDRPLTEALAGSGGEGDLFSLIPVRFYFDRGLNLGVEDFPVPGTGELEGTFPARFTVLGLNLGSPQAAVRFGLYAEQGDGKLRLRFGGDGQGGFQSSSTVRDGPVLFTHDTQTRRFAFGLDDAWRLGDFQFAAFGRMAQDGDAQGLALGGEVRYALAAGSGPFRVRLEPFVVGALYDAGDPYFAFGGRAEGRYDAEFSLRLAYAFTLEASPGKFWLERRDAANLLSGAFAYRGLSLQAEHNFLNAQTASALRYTSPQEFGQLWAEGFLRYRQGASDMQELVLGFTPNPLTCTDQVSLGFSAGYDLVSGRFSQIGAEWRFADCCFVWKLGYQETWVPRNPAQTPTGKLTFGLELR